MLRIVWYLFGQSKKMEIKDIIKNIVPKDLFARVRLRRILSQQRKVAEMWQPLIKRYMSGELETKGVMAKRSIGTTKIIWQYWGQGVDDYSSLPEVVRLCFDSVDKYAGEYMVVRLSDETVGDYIELPDFVYDKLRDNPEFTRTFFSDLLRVSLLSTYGGVWLDATVLLTGPLSDEYADMDYFMYRRSDEEEHKKYWLNVYAEYFGWHEEFRVRVSNSIIYAKKGSVMVETLRDLLLYYWETRDNIPHYFFFQILFEELVKGALSSHQCPVVNDCIPHVIQTKVNGGDYPYMSYEEAIGATSTHKMTYYKEEAMSRLRELLSRCNEVWTR